MKLASNLNDISIMSQKEKLKMVYLRKQDMQDPEISIIWDTPKVNIKKYLKQRKQNTPQKGAYDENFNSSSLHSKNQNFQQRSRSTIHGSKFYNN